MGSEPRTSLPDRDTALLARWRSGDPSAGFRLLRRQVDPTRRYFAGRVSCRADAEDLVQRTLLASLEALPRFREDTPFSRFVRAIASKLLLRHRRDSVRQRERRAEAGEPDTSPHDGPSAIETVLVDDASARVQRALGHLPERSAKLLRLHYWEDRDAAEIGRELGLNPGAVRTRLHRARHELRRALVTVAGSESGVWPMGVG